MCGMPILKKSSYTIKDIYAENYEEAVDAAQRTARIFGFKVPY